MSSVLQALLCKSCVQLRLNYVTLVQESRKVFLVPTKLVAELCEDEYGPDAHVRFGVDMSTLRRSVWDPEGAAQAETWTEVMALSGIAVSEVPAALWEMAQDDTMLSDWEDAARPACAPCSPCTYQAAVHNLWHQCRPWYPCHVLCSVGLCHATQSQMLIKHL